MNLILCILSLDFLFLDTTVLNVVLVILLVIVKTKVFITMEIES